MSIQFKNAVLDIDMGNREWPRHKDRDEKDEEAGVYVWMCGAVKADKIRNECNRGIVKVMQSSKTITEKGLNGVAMCREGTKSTKREEC